MISKLKKIHPTAFENLTYDILSATGLENAIWRTPGRDGGRDIEGLYFVRDLSGHRQPQKWYIECKKYKAAIDWPTIRAKLSYAESHAADFLLLATTSTASPQAIDETNRWNDLHGSPIIRIWGGYKIVQLLEQMPALQIKYGLANDPKAKAAVSVLPLSLITLKFTQSAYNESVFSGIEIPTLETAAALADLSTRRLEQIDSSGGWSLDYSMDSDTYAWVDNREGVDVSQFDRYALRALICVYRSMKKGASVKLTKKENGKILLSSDGGRQLEDAQLADLLAIASWGNFEIETESAGIVITRRREH